MQKSYYRKNDIKLSFSLLLLCAKVFRLYFLRLNFFVLFLTDSNSAMNFAFYDTHSEFFLLCQLFLPTLKPKSDETAQTNENVSVPQNPILHLQYLRSGRSILSKEVIIIKLTFVDGIQFWKAPTIFLMSSYLVQISLTHLR